MVKSYKILFGLLAALVVLVLVYFVFFGRSLEDFEDYEDEEFEGYANAKQVTYYYMDGCPHCKDFDPEWTAFEAEAAKKGIETRKVDGPANAEEAKAKGVTGFPTVIVKGSDGKEKEYDGARTSTALLAYVTNM